MQTNDRAVTLCCCSCFLFFHLMAVLACPHIRFPDPPASRKCHQASTNISPVPVTSYVSSTPAKTERSEMNPQSISSASSSSSSPKQKTIFQLAHPPPTIRHKQRLHIRPRLLLQLHETSLTTRPVPVLDVLPSTVFATRVARKFPTIFRGKNGLGPDDLIVARSPEYTSQHDELETSGHASLDSREVVAAICHPRKLVPGHGELDEIYLNDASCWQALQLPGGVYQLTSFQGTTNLVARWVPRHSVTRRQSLKSQGRAAAALPEDERFTFSLINPASRRHPVIASMTRRSIDIPSEYTDPFKPTAGSPQSPDRGNFFSDSSSQRVGTTLPMTEGLRTLILASGIWVAFREGFSPNFQYTSLGPSPPATPNVGSHHESRALAFAGDESRSPSRHRRTLSDSRPPLRSPSDGRFSIPSTPTYDHLASVPSRRAFSTGNPSPSAPRSGPHVRLAGTAGSIGTVDGMSPRMETWPEEGEDHASRLSVPSQIETKRQSMSSGDGVFVTRVGRLKRMFGLGRRIHDQY